MLCENIIVLWPWGNSCWKANLLINYFMCIMVCESVFHFLSLFWPVLREIAEICFSSIPYFLSHHLWTRHSSDITSSSQFVQNFCQENLKEQFEDTPSSNHSWKNTGSLQSPSSEDSLKLWMWKNLLTVRHFGLKKPYRSASTQHGRST